MTAESEPPPPSTSIAGFIAKWRPSAAAEGANSQSFLNDLCRALGIPGPRPTRGDSKRDLYVFEKGVLVSREGRPPTTKKIDLYKHGCFVLEAKQGSEAATGRIGTAKRNTPGWNVAMNAAFGQALEYANFLDEPPPFIIVTDIGYCFDLYASFDGSTNYRPFPSALAHRLYVSDVEKHSELLRAIFSQPLTLDPSRRAVEVTREVATHLAELSRRLEAVGHGPQTVAAFLMRCIFTMFAEDVGLLPGKIFSDALENHWLKSPKSFPAGIETLWRAMNEGTAFGFFGKLLHFNGGLFRLPAALPLSRAELEILHEAAKCTWRDVEPAIFGTLFERALDAKERHDLGAHFTPRSYVERLVRPTLEEPLREDWDKVQLDVRGFVEANKLPAAKAATRAFLKQLSETRVLDPACGSGNFLYVALDVLKRLEDEVFSLLLALEKGQADLCLDAPEVTPRQLLGIEVNPRAKEIAELVLWIGYLQWHFRTKHRGGMPREPVLQDFKNIECRDAVLAYDRQELRRNATTGKPLTRWDGETMKLHPATGERVPDERFTVPLYDYVNPRPAHWPEADFIVGNPPFIGKSRRRKALGDGYLESLCAAYAGMPDGADYVTWWWHIAAGKLIRKEARRFGFITTNSISQSLNRKVIADAIAGGVRVVFAIPNHPWVDAKSGAAVRIAMTVATTEKAAVPVLCKVISEEPGDDDEVKVELLCSRIAEINADLSGGTDIGKAVPLEANAGLCSVGVVLFGMGFVVPDSDAALVEPAVLRPLLNGRDLMQTDRAFRVVDFFPMSEAEARESAPRAFQFVMNRVKPERDAIRDPGSRKTWWRFGRDKPELRKAIAPLRRYIATPEVSKHRVFVFVDSACLPDHKLVAIAVDDGALLGVLSSRIHAVWSGAAGSRHGVGDDLVYNRSRCFDPFPFPVMSKDQRACIADLGEQIDRHRKRRQEMDPELTITGMYNVVTKLRASQPLTAKEKSVQESGLVSILRKLHDDLDVAVSEAYGWEIDLTEGEIVDRLIALNAKRAAEEKHSRLVRSLRPELQVAAAEEVTKTDAQIAARAPERRPGIAKSKPPKGPSVAPARPTEAKPTHKKKAR